jgi:hypothetical protein
VKSGPDRSGPYWVALIASLALILGGCAGSENATDLPLGRQVSAQVSVTPTVHLFAEPVVARAEVVVDREHLDPERLRLAASFAPYKQIGETRVEREDSDRYSRLTYTLTLRCLDRPCLAGEVSPGGPGDVLPGSAPPSRRGERVFRFRPAHVYYDAPGAGQPRHLKRVWWPRLDVLTRISPTDPSLTFAFNTPFRTTLRPLPEASYRISPGVLAAGLLAGAAVLLVLPAWLTVSWWRRRRPEPIVVEEVELTPLERALLLVEQAHANPNGRVRREALELLAHELAGSGSSELAGQARRLAWQSPPPTPDAAAAFVTTVRDANVA